MLFLFLLLHLPLARVFDSIADFFAFFLRSKDGGDDGSSSLVCHCCGG